VFGADLQKGGAKSPSNFFTRNSRFLRVGLTLVRNRYFCLFVKLVSRTPVLTVRWWCVRVLSRFNCVPGIGWENTARYGHAGQINPWT
jgi:hypothetical protein